MLNLFYRLEVQPKGWSLLVETLTLPFLVKCEFQPKNRFIEERNKYGQLVDDQNTPTIGWAPATLSCCSQNMER